MVNRHIEKSLDLVGVKVYGDDTLNALPSKAGWPSAWLRCSRGAYLYGPDGQTRNKGSLR